MVRTRWYQAAAAAAALWLWLAGAWAPGGEPAVSLAAGQAAVELPAVGVSLRALAGYALVPPGDLAVWVYRVPGTGEQFAAFLPAELWRRDQLGAQFRGTTGDLLVARLRYLPPENLPLVNGEHVRAADYRAAVAQQAVEWTPAAVEAWVAALAAATPAAPEAARAGAGLPARRFTFVEVAPEVRQGWLLTLPDGEAAFVLFLLTPGLPAADVERAVAAVIESVKPLAAGAKESAANGVKPAAAAEPPAAAPAGTATPPALSRRQRVIDSLAQRKDWWYIETAHYLVTSNLGRKDRELVERLGGELEVMRAIYERVLPSAKPVTAVGVVAVYRSRDEYRRAVPADGRASAGRWQPAVGELALTPYETPARPVATDALLARLHHEALYQYLHEAFPGQPLPPWFAEGHALLFAATLIDPAAGRVELREDTAAVPRLLELLNLGAVDLRRVLDLDWAAFAHPRTAADNQTLAWGLVYFLRRGAYQLPARGYAAVCPALLAAVSRSGGGQPVKADALDVDLKHLARDLYEFWRSPARRREAEARPLFDAERRQP